MQNAFFPQKKKYFLIKINIFLVKKLHKIDAFHIGNAFWVKLSTNFDKIMRSA